MKQNELLKAKVSSLQLNLDTVREEFEGQTFREGELVKDRNDTHEENEYLRLLVNDNQVNLFDDECKIYRSDTQECVYALLNFNVTTSKVSPVIETVLKLANLKPNKLPSVQTVNNMNIQRLLVAQKQVGEVPLKRISCVS